MNRPGGPLIQCLSRSNDNDRHRFKMLQRPLRIRLDARRCKGFGKAWGHPAGGEDIVMKTGSWGSVSRPAGSRGPGAMQASPPGF